MDSDAVTVHELKCWSKYFQAILDGTKKFELRRNDRGFKVGDILDLREYDERGKHTGRTTRRWVTYLYEFDRDLGPMLADGVVCMSLGGIEERPTAQEAEHG